MRSFLIRPYCHGMEVGVDMGPANEEHRRGEE